MNTQDYLLEMLNCASPETPDEMVEEVLEAPGDLYIESDVKFNQVFGYPSSWRYHVRLDGSVELHLYLKYDLHALRKERKEKPTKGPKQ